MAQGSNTLHEPGLAADVIDRHRAIVSIMEELEAVDWYDQRAAATTDHELRAILEHNRDEEKEHAMMTLEWLRRVDPVLDKMMRTYLFTTEPVTMVEKLSEGDGESDQSGSSAGDLGIGDLRLERFDAPSATWPGVTR